MSKHENQIRDSFVSLLFPGYTSLRLYAQDFYLVFRFCRTQAGTRRADDTNTTTSDCWIFTVAKLTFTTQSLLCSQNGYTTPLPVLIYIVEKIWCV